VSRKRVVTREPIISRAREIPGPDFDDLSEIATEPRKRSSALRAIEIAGFRKTDAETVLELLADGFRWYQHGPRTAHERPRASKLREELADLAECAEALADGLSRLSPVARQKLREVDVPPVVHAQDVKRLAATAREVARGQEDPTGRPADSSLNDLAKCFNAVWAKYGPRVQGVTKRGAAPDRTSGARFHGPLYELMLALCKLEGLTPGDDVIGNALHSLRSEPSG
jgi:hypothetical protein